jgi:hypothetical protein
MSVYTRYSKVLDVEGKPLSVREALVQNLMKGNGRWH